MSPAERPSKRRRVAWLSAGFVVFFLALSSFTTASLADGQGAAVENDDELENPYLGDPEAIEEGRQQFIRRCTGCHWNPLRGPRIFKTELSYEKFLEIVVNGRRTVRTMPPFGRLLSPDEIAKIYAFLQSRERLR